MGKSDTMDISETEVRNSKDGVIIAKSAPWLYYIIRYSKHDNQYIFYERDEQIDVFTIFYSTKNFNDLVEFVNNYFKKQLITLKRGD